MLQSQVKWAHNRLLELEMKLTTLTAATGGRNVEWIAGRVRQVLQTKRINSLRSFVVKQNREMGW